MTFQIELADGQQIDFSSEAPVISDRISQLMDAFYLANAEMSVGGSGESLTVNVTEGAFYQHWNADNIKPPPSLKVRMVDDPDTLISLDMSKSLPQATFAQSTSTVISEVYQFNTGGRDVTLTDVEYVSLADAFLEATPNGFVDSPTPDLSSYIWLDSEDGDLMIDLRKGDQPDYLISATGEPWNVSALNASDTPLNVHGVLVDPGHGLLHDARQVDFSAEIAAAERFDIRGSGSDEIMDATGSHRSQWSGHRVRI